MKALLTCLAVLGITLGLGNLGNKAQAHEFCGLVQSWYNQYLDRPADPYGMASWTNQLEAGVSPLAVQAGILGSHEYYHKNGCSPKGFVTALFLDICGRYPSPRELCHWTERLDLCGCRIKLATEFLVAHRPVVARPVAIPLARPVVSVPLQSVPPAPVYSIDPYSYPRRGSSFEIGFAISKRR